MKIVKLAMLMAVVAYLSGCASGAMTENMTYSGPAKSYESVLGKNLDVTEVSGGEETNPAWTSEISNDAFGDAVRQSLANQGLFAENGRYQLEVIMVEVDQPMFGLNFEVTTHVRYILTDRESGNVVLNETVVAPYTATVGDAFVAIKRLRLANEGSGRKNIEGLLDLLASLRIGAEEVSLKQ